MPNWTADRLLPNDSNAFGTTGTPALAVFNNKLYCAHRGRGDGRDIWMATFDGANWSPDVRIGFPTKHHPSLAVHNGVLYLAYNQQADGDLIQPNTGLSPAIIVVSSTDGVNWSSPTKVASGWKSPALVSFNNKLYCFVEGVNAGKLQTGSGMLTWYVLEGIWQTKQMSVIGTSGAPGLAVYNGKLFCIHEGNNQSGWLWCNEFDDANWSGDRLIPNPQFAFGTSGPPALAVYNGVLYCVREGRGNSGWLMCAEKRVNAEFDNDHLIPNNSNAFGTSGAPAIIEYKSKLYCIHEGRGNNGWLWCATMQ